MQSGTKFVLVPEGIKEPIFGAVWVRKILRVLREENFGLGLEGDMELLGSEMGTGFWPAQSGPNSAS